MASDDQTSVIVAPRIDRKFVDANGNLTMSGYALLDGLLRRTGGPVGSIISLPDIEAEFNELTAQLQAFGLRVDAVEEETQALELLPSPVEHAPTIEPQDGRLQQLEAQVHALTQQVNALLLR